MDLSNYKNLLTEDINVTNNKLLYKESDTLTEDILNSGKLSEVDDLFDQLLVLVKNNGKTEDKYTKSMKSLIDNAIKILNKQFNIRLTLNMIPCSEVPTIQNVAYTIIGTKETAELDKKILKLILSKKEGYTFIKARDITVYLEMAFLVAICNLDSFVSDSDKYNFNGRTITSIILHEIGHHVFLPIEVRKTSPDHIEIHFPDGQKPLVSSINNPSLVKAALYSITRIAMTTIGVGGFLIGTNGLLSAMKQKDFITSETNAESFTTQYGYAEESTMLTTFILAATNVKPKSIKNIFLRYLDTGNSLDILFRKNLAILDDEIKNKNNSKEQQQELKSVKKRAIKLYKESFRN